jgi:hypothetical protein
MPNPNIIYQDPVTGIYQDVDKTYYLKDGTPINDYDPKTGAYQEDDGTWYTYQGVPLKNYDKKTNSYQEMDGTWYDSTGNEIMFESQTLKLLKAAGYDVSNNNSDYVMGALLKKSKNNVSSATPIWLLPTLAFVGIALVGTIVYYTMKKK